jgi:CubicO group peptidase (beta-lactamase class C family)
MKKIFLLLLVICVQRISTAQSWQDTVALIEKAFDRYKPASPGAQLAISRNGQIVFSRSWGMADLEHAVSLTNESVIEAGSVSKQFTAAAILLLEQQGKLSINDDVRKYVPELPDYGNTITLRHMMQHTSGIKDWGAIASIAGWPRSTKTYSNEDALLIMSRQKTLNNQPGDEYLYSNSGYNLFAIIVERVSGLSLAEFTRIHIFESAGMKHTEWRNNYKKIVPNRAIAYSKIGNAYFTDMPNEYVYGNGGLLTTAEDLLTWNNYYLNGKLGNPSLLPKQLATTPLNNGRMNTYAAGLGVDSVRGWKSITHSGATAGYRSNLLHFPDLGLSIAWLSNSSEFDNAPNITNAIRDLLVKNITVAPKRNDPAPIDVPIEKLNSYAGWYRDAKTAGGVKLFIRNGKLDNSRGGTLVPVAENIFLLGQNRVEIQTGAPQKILLISPSDTVHFIAADSAQTDEKSLQEYTGSYWSDEADVKYSVLLKDGKLVVHQDPKTDFTVTPLYKDGFNIGGTNIYFERNKKNRITSMKIFTGRARNVEFRKIMK